MNSLFLRVVCLAVVMAMALRCDTSDRNPVDPGLSGPPVEAIQGTGSIGGTVSVDGMPIGRTIVNGVLTQIAEVVLLGPAGNRTTSTGASGRFAFGTLPPGSYALTVSLADDFLFTFTCESITLTVQASETATANISCTGHPIPLGKIGGQVTINGEARPIVWVELQRVRDGFPWGYGTTIPSGRWEFGAPEGDYVVVIKAPPGLTCDAMRKSATVRGDQTTIVNFACVGDVKGSIQGFTSHENGTFASARVTLTGPVNRETISNGDGFFAFEDLPPGAYVLDLCQPWTVTVQEGATAFVTLDCS